MRVVAGPDGTRYVLLKESEESSLVRDPDSGEERFLPNDDWEPVEGTAPLAAAASAVPEPVRQLLAATHDDQSLGLVVELVDRGPVGVRELLSAYDLCESDLHGVVLELRAAGLVAEADAAGERGYDATETAHEAVATLRDR